MRNCPNADIDVLRHILKYCNNIAELISRFGNDIEVFKADLAFRDSVSMNILQIGELTGHLSEEYRQSTKSHMPWPAIKAMRNLFAHNYGQMNLSVIWSTATENIPQLKAFCEAEISKAAPENDNDEDIDI